MIQDAKARHLEQMDNTSIHDSQDRPPTPSRGNPITSDWSDDDRKDDQARASIAKPTPQDLQTSTSFGTGTNETLRRPNTYPKVLTFGRGKLVPLASGTSINIGCGYGLHINQAPPTKKTSYSTRPSITRYNSLQ